MLSGAVRALRCTQRGRWALSRGSPVCARARHGESDVAVSWTRCVNTLPAPLPRFVPNLVGPGLAVAEAPLMGGPPRSEGCGCGCACSSLAADGTCFDCLVLSPHYLELWRQMLAREKKSCLGASTSSETTHVLHAVRRRGMRNVINSTLFGPSCSSEVEVGGT